ncbi:DUF4142 domain-containing protein [Telluribacter sp. SYSU D00476]|uniref:DUF4142 domain-containing protein n=1 Tax=Telluribacter sp. SYSU D00476 TaxID=2811430 RepID=UPI001FF28BB1|nr:DUF4142 domain-containing protein [Telluribacter sp. SYSU D00476]
MKYVKWNLLLWASLWIATSCRNESTPNVVAVVDRTFALEAAQTNLMGLRLGQLVQNNAQSQDVKDYSVTMNDYFNKASNDLLRIANRKNIPLPSTLSTINQADFDRLSALKGSSFDTAYIDWSIQSHQKTIEQLRQHTMNSTDEDLKTWASGRLTALEQSLNRAQTIQRSFTNTM